MPIEIKSCSGNRKVQMSDEKYVVLNDNHPSLRKGTEVRLISGVDGKKVIGYHFDSQYVTVTRADCEYATWCGVKKTAIKKII